MSFRLDSIYLIINSVKLCVFMFKANMNNEFRCVWTCNQRCYDVYSLLTFPDFLLKFLLVLCVDVALIHAFANIHDIRVKNSQHSTFNSQIVFCYKVSLLNLNFISCLHFFRIFCLIFYLKY